MNRKNGGKDDGRKMDELQADPRKWEKLVDPIGVEQEEAVDL